MCFCFKTSYLMYIAYSFTLNSWPTALYLVTELNSFNTPMFSIWHIIAFLSLGTMDNSSTLSFRTILNSEITKRKHINVTNVALNRAWKDDFLHYERWNKMSEQCLIWSELGMCASGDSIYLFIYLCYSEHVHVQEWDDYESSISIDFVMPNKFQWVSECIIMKFTSNEGQLLISSLLATILSFLQNDIRPPILVNPL